MRKLSKVYWSKDERCKAYGLYIKLEWKRLMRGMNGSFESFMETKYDGRFDNAN